MMQEVTGTDAGITLLRWIHHLTGFARPSMNMEEAVRRDIWLTLRRFIPVDKLAQIEYADLQNVQEQVHLLMQANRIEQERLNERADSNDDTSRISYLSEYRSTDRD
jgi:hypothetical protein